ncbi:MAG: 50S ribosomal protein L16 [Candidatus Muiribacteriota bacterium]|jgi:large subunit ribosomal protein L16
MLIPKKVKYRKLHTGDRVPKGEAQRGTTLFFGSYGLCALEGGWITSQQIEAARIALTRYMKRSGKVWIRIFPQKPVTSKPAETRMGKGKGGVDHWVAVVKTGRILFELEGVPMDIAKRAMELASHKLPVKTKFIYSSEIQEAN